MLEILIPSSFMSERHYIISVLFQDFLNEEYIIKTYNERNYTIILPGGEKVIILDDFFSKINEETGYIKKNYIPEKISYSSNRFTTEKDIPVIYGSEHPFRIYGNEIECPIDIFASSFFMLTRWEEMLGNIYDEHERFPSKESLSGKNGFLDRPVVNEYVEMLKNMFLYHGYNCNQNNDHKIVLTHDIDNVEYWKGIISPLRRISGDILKRKKFNLFLKDILDYTASKSGFKRDPYDNLEWIMANSEKNKLNSHFYFLSGGITEYDNRYNINSRQMKRIFNKIKKRNHTIGFHGSYDSYRNSKIFKNELNNLVKSSGATIKEGRQHFLRFSVPHTWQVWEDAGMKIDSTCGYADCEGFRCGTGNAYHTFDVLRRKKLELKERPLIVMDTTLKKYRKLSAEEGLKILYKYKSIGIKYDMPITVLFHNHIFNQEGWEGWDTVYQEFISSV